MEKIECPVCGKQYLSVTIEEHVGRCLFLNESTKEDNFYGSQKSSQKRTVSRPGPSFINDTLPGRKISPVLKRQKQRTNDLSQNLQSNLTSSPTAQYAQDNIQQLSSSKVDKASLERSQVKHEIKWIKSMNKNHVPLAEKMRPTSLITYVGQEHVLGPQTMLYQLLKKSEVPNIILWGPPGSGKTSLANVIAHICSDNSPDKLRYVKLSAAMSGVSEVKDSVNIAANELKFGRRTILFMDEIHRFNKLQQDIFLPHIESGTITLIGATTENPSFSLNSALLSRCRVVVLEKLSVENLISILERTVESLEGKIDCQNKSLNENSNYRFLIDKELLNWLAEISDGDARIALSSLELAILSKTPVESSISQENKTSITMNDIRESLKKTHMLYDKKGDQHYDIISALHKSVRASDENASIYWLARMLAGGEDPLYIARRLVRMASEDVGLEDPTALGIAVNAMQGCKMLGMPECDVLLAQCVIYLSRAPKSRIVENSLRAAQKLIAEHKGPQPIVPLHLRNAPTRLMSNLGYSKGYNMKHKDESGLTYLPEGLENVNFFQSN